MQKLKKMQLGRVPPKNNVIKKNNQKSNWIGAGEFKSHCLQLIDQVNKSRSSLVITKHGKPLATLSPFEEKPFSLFGCMKDTVVIHGNIVEPTGEVWEADAG